MNNRVILSVSCCILLFLLLCAPALAATVTCPSSCSCLLPAEAKKLGYAVYCGGKQNICGYDAQKNEKYCYDKTATTVPPLIATLKPVVTTAKPTVTTTPSVVQCPPGCLCLNSADGKAKGLPYCGGKRVLCGYDKTQTPLYCFSSTTTTKVTTTQTTVPSSCPSGCSCLAPDKADAAGYTRCSGSSAACSADPLGRPMYCYVTGSAGSVRPVAAGTATAGTSGTPAPAGGAVPINLPVTSPATTPQPEGGAFSAIGTFFASLFGGKTVPNPQGFRVIDCPGELTDCDGQCVDLSSDVRNCGRCRGVCYGQLDQCCDGVCSSPLSAENCGRCGNRCGADEPCMVLSGGSPFCSPAGCWNNDRSTNCGTGTCVDLLWDPNNCGSCGNECAADAGCTSGVCTPCPAGTARCNDGRDGFCQNLQSYPYSCGGCGIVCDPDKICEGGRCVPCPAGKDRCGISCVDLQTSYYSCGSCGNWCNQTEPDVESCCGGQCTNLKTNETHCGTCGNTCSAGQMCLAGTCALMPTGRIPEVTCRIGQTACSGTCTTLDTDEFNCGACGRACLSGRVCIDGTCLMAGGEDGCGLGQIRCSGRCVYPETNRANCGRCGHECPDRYYCRESTCTPFFSGDDTVCEEPGLDYCNGECIDVRTSIQNCGRCGNACIGGTCHEGTCYDTETDRENCGSIDHRCAAGQACCGGRCVADRSGEPGMCGPCSTVACTYPGLGCCNGYCWDLGSDILNCGTCRHECAEGRDCCGGSCVNLRENRDNCGACGHDCPWYETFCVRGHCSAFPWTGTLD